MGEWEEKLNQILGDQAAMGQIVALAQSLSGAGGKTAAPAPPEPPAPAGQPAPAEGGGPDWSAVLNLLSSLKGGEKTGETPPEPAQPAPPLPELDPRLLQTGLRLLSEYNRADDKNTALLAALRPFVREERYAKLDRAIQIARLSRVIRVAFAVMREQGGVEDV